VSERQGRERSSIVEDGFTMRAGHHRRTRYWGIIIEPYASFAASLA